MSRQSQIADRSTFKILPGVSDANSPGGVEAADAAPGHELDKNLSEQVKEYCDLRSAISERATIITPKPGRQPPAGTTLATLPASFDYGPRMPWGVVPTSVLSKLLKLDRGLLGTWINRGIGPQPLPLSWFKPGRSNYWRIDQVHAWLAERRGERFEHLTVWRTWIDANYANPDPNTVEFAQGLASDAWGRRQLREDGVRFKPDGFHNYVIGLADKP